MSSDATTQRACTCGAEFPPEGQRCAQCGRVHQPALVLGGKWKVERRLGAGGMGAVYLALDLALGRHVAVKVLHPNLVDDKSFVARFQREARVLARLDHPSIVPVYACETAPEGVLLVMKHIEGPTLSAYLKARGRLSPTETAALLVPLASAVGALHRHGLVHRDLKPSNVIVQDGGHLVLLDFGLARHSKDTDHLTTPGTALGSGPYMAPEQALGEPIDHRTDLYAIAVVAFQCLTGEVPFAKEGAGALFRRISKPPPLASTVVPSLGQALCEVVARGMALKPDDRFASVADFVQAFLDASRPATAAADDTARTQRATMDEFLKPGSAKK